MVTHEVLYLKLEAGLLEAHKLIDMGFLVNGEAQNMLRRGARRGRAGINVRCVRDMFCYSHVVRRQRHIGSGLCAFPLNRLLYAVMYNYSMRAEAIACNGREFEEQSDAMMLIRWPCTLYFCRSEKQLEQ